MAGLACEIEEEVLILEEVVDAVGISNVRDVDLNIVLEGLDVEEVTPVLWYQRVDDGDPSPGFNEPLSEVRADEPKPPGDKDALTLKVRAEIRLFLHRG